MSEKMAAEKTGQLLSFLAHSHKKHVIHRYVSVRRACPKHMNTLLTVVANVHTYRLIQPGTAACSAHGS